MYLKNSDRIYNIGLFLLFSALIFSGCYKNDADTTDKLSKSDKTGSQEVIIYSVERSPQIPFARVNITFPSQYELLEDDDVFVVIDVDNFQLGTQTDTLRARELSNSPKGQHVHIIIDNKTYIAAYEQDHPINVGKLGPGTHTIFAFPSRSYHESVKSPTAFDIINFDIGFPGGSNVITKDTPSIVYSRPKGTYKGVDAKEIMLDFYLNDVELSQGGKFARYSISKNNGEGDSGELYTIDVHEWKPSFIRGLSSGIYTVTLELLDNNGNLVPGAWNKTTREIEVISE